MPLLIWSINLDRVSDTWLPFPLLLSVKINGGGGGGGTGETTGGSGGGGGAGGGGRFDTGGLVGGGGLAGNVLWRKKCIHFIRIIKKKYFTIYI